MKILKVLLSVLVVSYPAFSQENEILPEPPDPPEIDSRIPESETTYKDANPNSASFYLGSNLSTIFQTGVQQSIEIGWLISEYDRVEISYSHSSEADDNDASVIESTNDSRTPPNTTRVNSETKENSYGLSYIRHITSSRSVKIRGGIGYIVTSETVKQQSLGESFVNDSEGTYFLTQIEVDTKSEISTARLFAEFEYSIWNDIALGFILSLQQSVTKTQGTQTTNGFNYSDGILVGISDPSITESVTESTGLATLKSGLYFRYYF